MTTDITELAQREKFEAWAEEAGTLPRGILKKHRNQDGSYPGPHYTYMWKAWQAASAELAEALEKAQQLATQQGNIACALFDEVTAQRQRIAELEEAEQQLCAANVTLDARAELAERQLAELESRTVTVNLPQRLQPGADGWDDWYMHSDNEGEYLKFDDVLAMLTAAGIKVEAE
ncbi:TPA: hypothetical protein L9V78_002123 [Klebsiella pneumoniae]|nr:hypothetical protein [Klebsiella pneumoniae]